MALCRAGALVKGARVPAHLCITFGGLPSPHRADNKARRVAFMNRRCAHARMNRPLSPGPLRAYPASRRQEVGASDKSDGVDAAPVSSASSASTSQQQSAVKTTAPRTSSKKMTQTRLTRRPTKKAPAHKLAAARNICDVYIRGVPLAGLGDIPMWCYPKSLEHKQLILVASTEDPTSDERLRNIAQLTPHESCDPSKTILPPVVGDEESKLVRVGEVVDFLPVKPLATNTVLRVAFQMKVVGQVRIRAVQFANGRAMTETDKERSSRARVSYIGRISSDYLPQIHKAALAWNDVPLQVGKTDCRDFCDDVLSAMSLNVR
ncbi:hypothetical protein PPROV_000373500 [Pycnococcus provasolii]|uniref:Uncharacterized protein n=1 Tax=Pycnococcus provasolii TaxID=41880 RepID=A0A830HEQ6_9CHLO|nr:hypothetical protein PPROV_000373500 [Pycnococcus provasolii]